VRGDRLQSRWLGLLSAMCVFPYGQMPPPSTLLWRVTLLDHNPIHLRFFMSGDSSNPVGPTLPCERQLHPQ
jgi:hypothetical protein